MNVFKVQFVEETTNEVTVFCQTKQQQNKVIATWDLWSKKIKQNSKNWDEKQELMMAVIETMIEKGLHEEQPNNKRKRI
jgi:hypothetical protein